MVGLQVNEKTIPGALQLNPVTPDTTSPVLLSFDEFNLENYTLIFTVDEPVNSDSVNISGVYLQYLFENPLSRVQLVNGGYLPSINTTILRITMNIADIDSIKLDPYVCTYRGDCYLKLLTSFIQDMNQNPMQQVSVDYCTF